jgi:23S rRNA pseudouridine1911/1915/1917 synthase
MVHVGKRARVARSRDLDAQPAATAYEVLAHGHDLALVRATTSSGRMHQVRVHLMHLGHPIVGDALYGGPPPAPGTQGHFLHASAITFPHPTTGKRLTLEAPLPADRAEALRRLVNWPQR